MLWDPLAPPLIKPEECSLEERLNLLLSMFTLQGALQAQRQED